MRKHLILLMAFLSISVAQAQECSTLLSKGIYDITSSYKEESSTASFSQWFCDQEFSSADQANDFGASLGFPFKGVPVKLGFNSSSQTWKQWYSNFCGSVRTDENLKSKVKEHVQEVNPHVMSAFNACMQADGLHVWLERTYDPRVFRFVGRFNTPDPKLIPSTKIINFDTGSNVTCHHVPEEISKAEWRTNCDRKNNAPVSIVVNATTGPILGGGKLDLPAIKNKKPEVTPITGDLSVKCVSATEVVKGLYLQILERNPDEGMHVHVDALTSKKATVREVVSSFVNSPEYTERFVKGKSKEEVVKGLYKHVLARTPDPDGLSTHVTHLPTAGFSQVAVSFVDSPEYDQRFGNWVVPAEKPTMKYCY